MWQIDGPYPIVVTPLVALHTLMETCLGPLWRETNVTSERRYTTRKAFAGACSARSQSGWSDWPMLTHNDYVLVGAIVVLYSHMDVNLRRIAELADDNNMLRPPWKGKTAKLTMTDIEKAVMSLDWSAENLGALEMIAKRRGLRNMLAHFMVRRFHHEDAFLFVAINASDYERQLGIKPRKGQLLSAVVDVDQIKRAMREIEHVQLWLGQATSQFEIMVAKREGR